MNTILAELEVWMMGIKDDLYSGKYKNRIEIQRKYWAIDRVRKRIKDVRRKNGLTNGYILCPPSNFKSGVNQPKIIYYGGEK